MYEQYLRLIDFTTYTDFSKLVMDSYSQLYKKGKISSNYFTGFFLENITNGNNEYADIIQQNKQYGLLAFHSDSLFLNEQIDLLCCIYKDKCNEKETITKAVEKEWINLLPKNPWDIIYFRIPSNSQNIGYGFGLSRLLTFVTNKNHCFV